MATLTEAAYIVRKGIAWGSIGIVALTILGIGTSITIRRIQESKLSPTPTPGVSFGSLPRLVFPASQQFPESFELLLIEGRPPETINYGNIYLIRAKTPTLLSRKETQQFAQQLGFPAEPSQVNNTIYQFSDADTNSQLTVDISSKNFTLRRNFIDVSVLNRPLNQNENEIRKQAHAFFVKIGVWHDNLTQPFVTYWTFEGQNLRETPNAEEARLARVDFLQPTIGEIPVLTSKPKRSHVYVMFAPGDKSPHMVLEASFHYHAPDMEMVSSYPLISGKTAWEQLLAGNGYITSPVKVGTKATVRRIYLAYYQSDDYQPYLQPVWIFEGDYEFIGLVPAVDPTWHAPQ